MTISLAALSALPPASSADYIGRFAPSPTGPLHMGSLVSALASYLDAHCHQGQWLVRMEDLDPPREQVGAADSILRALADHGLTWDGPVLYQSQRLEAYAEVLAYLQKADWAYPCNCTRQDLQAMGGVYNGHCRSHPVDLAQPHAWRLKLYDLPQCHTTEQLDFIDIFQGRQTENLRTAAGDQIIKRKDGLFAYQLAVVIDDIAQQITHVVRGCDLLDVSARQLFLFQLLGAAAPAFGHVPLVLNSHGQKLSKQNLAPPLLSEKAGNNLWQALVFLGQNPPAALNNAGVDEVLSWAQANWQRALVGTAQTEHSSN